MAASGLALSVIADAMPPLPRGEARNVPVTLLAPPLGELAPKVTERASMLSGRARMLSGCLKSHTKLRSAKNQGVRLCRIVRFVNCVFAPHGL